MSYSKFTQYYDEIVRGNWYSLDDEVDLICEFIKKFWNNWKSVLEFACWSGVVGKELQQKWYEIFGIDLSESMLEKANINMWVKNCGVWDMTNYISEKKYDAVLCNYNSICHLTDWKSWQECFKAAYSSLEVGGLFIFDINTVQEFESIARDFAQFYNIWEDTICLEMQKESWLYNWIVKMFIKNNSWKYDLSTENIPELSFEIDVIQAELKKVWFQNLHCEDFHKWTVDNESERVYFIAKKI